MITSMREHKGYLYLGGVSNNRIGRYKLPGADPNWCAQDDLLGQGEMIAALKRAYADVPRLRRETGCACP